VDVLQANPLVWVLPQSLWPRGTHARYCRQMRRNFNSTTSSEPSAAPKSYGLPRKGPICRGCELPSPPGSSMPAL
jgi:hypothetical protein